MSSVSEFPMANSVHTYDNPLDYDKPPYFKNQRLAISDVIKKVLLSFQKQSGSIHVLDVGCGTGKQARDYVQDPRVIYTGIDTNLSMIQTARRYIGIYWAQQKFYNVSLEEFKEGYIQVRKFDVVNCCSMIYHVNNTHYFIDQLVDSLTPEGTLILEADRPFNWFDSLWKKLFVRGKYKNPDPGHYFNLEELNYKYSQADLIRRLEYRGLAVQAYGSLFLPTLIPWEYASSTSCPLWLEKIYDLLCKLDRKIAPHFPKLSSQFILVATKSITKQRKSAWFVDC